MGVPAREHRLAASLAEVDDTYDRVLVDCPPSLGLLTVNALTAADGVLIPIQAEFYAMEGLGNLVNTIRLIRGSLNPRLEIEGVVITMFDRRTRLSFQVADEVRRHLNGTVYDTVVPRSIRLSEAPSHGMPIAMYDPASRGADAYEAPGRGGDGSWLTCPLPASSAWDAASTRSFRLPPTAMPGCPSHSTGSCANPQQPRARFDTDQLDALAVSIAAHGVLQPIVVRAAWRTEATS